MRHRDRYRKQRDRHITISAGVTLPFDCLFHGSSAGIWLHTLMVAAFTYTTLVSILRGVVYVRETI